MSSDRHTPRHSRPWRPLKRFMQGLFRFFVHLTSGRRSPQAGFVFPTTLLLILMVTLTATALAVRTFSRSEQAITQRQQQVIYNAATPTIDRAKAKLEFMFQTDNRFPSGVPASDQLANLMLRKTDQIPGASVVDINQLGLDPDDDDPYTLPGETRLDLNGDTFLDNAWSFDPDPNDDRDEVVIYSILVDDAGLRDATDVDITESDPETKAKALVTRTGPLATTEATPLCKGARSEGGWQVVSAADNSSLQKNFQVNAVVVQNPGSANPVFETLEFQQSRIAARANKWGAWFRYDLEIHPGPGFNWNGAMHTDGNIMMAGGIEPFMISSFNSCLYSQEASEITLGAFDNGGATDSDGNPIADGDKEDLNYDPGELGDFQGQAIVARTAEDEYRNDTLKVHVFNGVGEAPNRRDFKKGTDSIDNKSGGRPSDVSMNPLILFTQGRESHIAPKLWDRDTDWDDGDFTVENSERIYNDETAKPFVDDFYRADNRWGPKPRYDSKSDNLDVTKVSTAKIGSDITETDVVDTLTGPEEGLDGYWERQAILKGLRIIMGQRLELGNANGWNSDPSGIADDPNVNAVGDPLYPPKALHDDLNELDGDNASDRVGKNHEYLQRKTLRDNLAAVQGMVVYHYEGPGSMASDGTFPAACLAMTAHPGTEDTIINSRTFGTYDINSTVLKTDFLTGQGTNGWEFKYHPDFDTPSEFADEVVATAPLGKALRNLAYFAGDPAGGAPSFPPVQDSVSHPYPYQAMWGDFSMLRRIIDDGGLDSATAFGALSPADQATVHSAACTLSLLAYNLQSDYNELKEIFANAPDSMQDVSQHLGKAIRHVMDCLEDSNGTPIANACNGTGSFEVIDFLKARGDLDSTTGSTIWVEDETNTEIPVVCPATGANADEVGFQANCDTAEYFAEWTLDDWLALIAEDGVIPSLDTADDDGDGVGNDVQSILEFSSQVSYYSSIIRDRDLGFREGFSPNTPLGYNPTASSVVSWDNSTGLTEGITNTFGGAVFKVGCDPNTFQSIVAGGGGGKDNNVAISLVACSSINQYPIKYPSLYYLFPLNNHSHGGSGYHLQPGASGYTGMQANEEYVEDSYITSINPATGADAVEYQILKADNVSTEVFEPIEGPGEIAAVPQPTVGDWVLPINGTATTVLSNPDSEPFRISYKGSGYDVPMLDKGIFNGRELLNVRVLDLDMDAFTGNNAIADNWISSDLENQAEGIVYAFREDSVREDEIVRPKNSGSGITPAYCRTVDRSKHPRLFAIERDDKCYMQVNPDPTAAQDPPLTVDLVSFKPVDFVPDPERRPHGWRFRTATGVPVDFSNGGREVGMTFVTDDSIYIWGDFNLHVKVDATEGTSTQLEEFEDTILAGGFGFDDFYKNRKKDELDLENFADPDVDHWRPVELLSDAVTVLSKDFVDGSVADTFTENKNSEKSSYTNQTRPLFGTAKAQSDWVQENPDNPDSPIWVDRNGTYYEISGGSPTPFYELYKTNNDWRDLNDDRTGVQDATDTYVNAVFVSGIVPTRAEQPYGGIHNYIRFIENWKNVDLYMQGSFIQLDFSTGSTGPFDQDAIEPGETPDDDELINYYRPPDRYWGYDVGLLYVPPGPAAKRFVTIGSPRSEYYREVAADDPYIVNLRCAKDASGNELFSDLCPN